MTSNFGMIQIHIMEYQPRVMVLQLASIPTNLMSRDLNVPSELELNGVMKYNVCKHFRVPFISTQWSIEVLESCVISIMLFGVQQWNSCTDTFVVRNVIILQYFFVCKCIIICDSCRNLIDE